MVLDIATGRLGDEASTRYRGFAVSINKELK